MARPPDLNRRDSRRFPENQRRNTRENQRRNTEVAALQSSLDGKNRQISQLTEELRKAEQATPRIRELQAEVDRLNQENRALTEREQRANAQVRQLRDEVSRLESQIGQLKDDVEKIATLQKQIEELEAQEGLEISLADLIDNTSKQLEVAQRKLREKGSTFRLGHISMDLRMLPVGTGAGLSFIRRDDIASIGENQLSSIKLDFNPSGAVAAAKPTMIAVPDVAGLTEIMARRKLSAAGLSVEVAYQAVTVEAGRPSQVGRVVEQWPAVGEKVTQQSIVTISLGKATVRPGTAAEG